MSLVTRAAFIASCRSAVGDTGSGRESTVRSEDLQGVDGKNKEFETLFFPLLTLQVYLTHNDVTTLQTINSDYTVDLPTGRVFMNAAPVAGDPIDRLQASYTYTWYADTDYDEFILEAARMAGFPSNPSLGAPSAQVTGVLPTIPDEIMDAVIKFVGHVFNRRRATEFSNRVNSSAGGQTVQAQSLATAFDKQAKAFLEEGMKLVSFLYQRRGRRDLPVAAQGAYSGLQVKYQPPQ